VFELLDFYLSLNDFIIGDDTDLQVLLNVAH
jgi:hypothetical protein